MGNFTTFKTSREKLDAEMEDLDLSDEVRQKLSQVDGVLLDIIAGSKRQGDFLRKLLQLNPDMEHTDMEEFQFVTDFFRSKMKRAMVKRNSDNTETQVVG